MGYGEFFSQYPIAKAIMAFVAAGILASFACVVFERSAKGISIHGRSVCVCGVQIKAWYNIPIIGWLVQGGVARCCGSRIPSGYFLAELISATYAAVIFYIAPFVVSALSTIVVIVSVGYMSSRVNSSGKDKGSE